MLTPYTRNLCGIGLPHNSGSENNRRRHLTRLMCICGQSNLLTVFFNVVNSVLIFIQMYVYLTLRSCVLIVFTRTYVCFHCQTFTIHIGFCVIATDLIVTSNSR